MMSEPFNLVTVVDVDQNQAMKPERKTKSRRLRSKAELAQFTSGLTNKQQFDQLFKAYNYLNERNQKLETEINNLKAILSLCVLNPAHGVQTVEQSQLPQLYQERINLFIQCMKP